MWVCLMKDHLFIYFLTRCGNLRFQHFGGTVGEDQELGASLDYWRGIGDRRRVDK